MGHHPLWDTSQLKISRIFWWDTCGGTPISWDEIAMFLEFHWCYHALHYLFFSLSVNDKMFQRAQNGVPDPKSPRSHLGPHDPCMCELLRVQGRSASPKTRALSTGSKKRNPLKPHSWGAGALKSAMNPSKGSWTTITYQNWEIFTQMMFQILLPPHSQWDHNLIIVIKVVPMSIKNNYTQAFVL